MQGTRSRKPRRKRPRLAKVRTRNVNLDVGAKVHVLTMLRERKSVSYCACVLRCAPKTIRNVRNRGALPPIYTRRTRFQSPSYQKKRLCAMNEKKSSLFDPYVLSTYSRHHTSSPMVRTLLLEYLGSSHRVASETFDVLLKCYPKHGVVWREKVFGGVGKKRMYIYIYI